ncbi:hypothetical protein ABZ313_18875 [Streptomyces sp. NPDC006251]|uniref:hypothetical protein n=1 Tax=Streptomyces sp. NPDC006251 TaxID=3155718 RepID=UPI0033BE33D7
MERGGRLDGMVRADRAKHRKGSGTHHKPKATGNNPVVAFGAEVDDAGYWTPSSSTAGLGPCDTQLPRPFAAVALARPGA